MGLDNPIHIVFLLIVLLMVFGRQAPARDGQVAGQRHAWLQGRPEPGARGAHDPPSEREQAAGGARGAGAHGRVGCAGGGGRRR